MTDPERNRRTALLVAATRQKRKPREEKKRTTDLHYTEIFMSGKGNLEYSRFYHKSLTTRSFPNKISRFSKI